MGLCVPVSAVVGGCAGGGVPVAGGAVPVLCPVIVMWGGVSFGGAYSHRHRAYSSRVIYYIG